MGRDAARRYQEKPVPGRPSHTEEQNARVPRERVHVDYPQEGDIQPPVAGYVPSASDPVPVYLTQAAPARRTRVRRVAGNISLRANKTEQLCGSDLRRKRLFIRNLDDTHNVFILPEGETIDIGGFKLEPAQDVELFDNSEVWIRAEANDVDVTWLLEQEVDQ